MNETTETTNEATQEPTTALYEGTEETNETTAEENKGFDFNDMSFEDNFTFGGYDLSNFKEQIDMNENSVKALEGYASKFGELGLTQEQVEGVISQMLESEQPRSADEIKQDLNKHLSLEEKRAYSANCNLLQKALQGTEEEKFLQSITEDPFAVKVLGRVINYMRGGRATSGARTERETKIATLTGEQAVEMFNKYLGENLGNSNREMKQKELLAKLDDKGKQYFKEVLGL